MDTHIEKMKEVYGSRMRTMKECINKYFPAETIVTNPTGGMFFWVELPKSIDTTKLLPIAVKENVAFVPGAAFHPDGTGQNTMRLNFSKSNEEEIEEGFQRLGKVIEEQLNNK